MPIGGTGEGGAAALSDDRKSGSQTERRVSLFANREEAAKAGLYRPDGSEQTTVCSGLCYFGTSVGNSAPVDEDAGSGSLGSEVRTGNALGAPAALIWSCSLLCSLIAIRRDIVFSNSPAQSLHKILSSPAPSVPERRPREDRLECLRYS